jgi:ParB family chromosome partitioning protein
MAPKRTGLGRGIGALIPTSSEQQARPVDVFFPAAGSSGAPTGTQPEGGAAAATAEELVAVPGARLANLNPLDIVPNAAQPRKEFREEELQELVHSIREIGLLQPIVVRPIPGATGTDPQYELIMGERRLRATKELGLATIPAIVKETPDDAMLRDALLENLHRAQLNPLEEASAYQQLLADFGITQEELATRIGRSRPQITNTIRLLRLPSPVQRRVAAGVLSAGHARAILAAPDAASMEYLAEKIVNEDLSVRAAEAAAAKLGSKPARLKPVAGKRQAHLDDVASRLSDRLNTSVRISLGARKGTVSIDFATVADLKRILEELGSSDLAG